MADDFAKVVDDAVRNGIVAGGAAIVMDRTGKHGDFSHFQGQLSRPQLLPGNTNNFISRLKEESW